MSEVTAAEPRMPGATKLNEGFHFRVWAPRRKQVQVVFVDEQGERSGDHRLTETHDGYFAAQVIDAQPGQLYWYQLDDESKRYPDPASRFQPQGVHGPSQLVDATSYRWQDAGWNGPKLPGQVLYELHVGTFTREGTWAAAQDRLPHLAELGVTCVEVMPVADFQGEFGWGYDGVYWFAPTRLYGNPDDFRAFVDEAHRLGLAVILDVVYNHFGPTGNYLAAFSPYFASKRHPTDWGEAINYDGEQAGPIRDFVAANAAYWIADFHLDGLRLDATQAIYDDSDEHILAVLTRAARQAAGERSILIFAENDVQDVAHVEPPERGGYGMDGLWNDDFHHACRVAATGHAEFYYSDFAGSPQEIISALKWGYLYQGQWTNRLEKFRGTPAHHRPARNFVHFLQNHDQVANSAKGLRTHLLTTPGRFRALTAILLLGPQTPMLFMGQEIAAANPFLYFADHEVDIANMVRDGRWEFLRRFPRAASYHDSHALADPASAASFQQSKIDWDATDEETLLLHRDLLRLRRDDPVFSRQDARMIEAAVVGPEAFVLRWFDEAGDDRLMIVNLGRDLHWHPVAQPLMAAPAGKRWRLAWSSEDPRYGGSGTAVLDIKDWNLPGHAAIVLRPEPLESADGR